MVDFFTFSIWGDKHPFNTVDPAYGKWCLEYYTQNSSGSVEVSKLVAALEAMAAAK